jgi:hypothetical protein
MRFRRLDKRVQQSCMFVDRRGIVKMMKQFVHQQAHAPSRWFSIGHLSDHVVLDLRAGDTSAVVGRTHNDMEMHLMIGRKFGLSEGRNLLGEVDHGVLVHRVLEALG